MNLLLSPVSTRLPNLFDGLQLGEVDVELPTEIDGGTFHFCREGERYRFSDLSAGEREAFDILLDFYVSSIEYTQAIYCIDEPELHLHTESQARLLPELLHLLPEKSQLWIATHSIGFIKAALDLHSKDPDSVVFLDFHDFKASRIVSPSRVDRQLWKRSFAVALHDLAGLIASSRIVLCEGRWKTEADKKRKTEKAEFDAKIFDRIFGPYMPDTDFVASRACNDIITDSSKIGSALGSLLPGVTVIKIVDRDCDRAPHEIHKLRNEGIKVLSWREIENYLWHDQILEKLGESLNLPREAQLVIDAKRELLNKAPADLIDPCDDVKSITGDLFAKLKQLLPLKESGSRPHDFALHILAPLVTPGTLSYDTLDCDIFG